MIDILVLAVPATIDILVSLCLVLSGQVVLAFFILELFESWCFIPRCSKHLTAPLEAIPFL